MQRKFVTSLALLLLLNFLIKPFWLLGIDLQVQIAVGFEQYGFYYSAFNIALMLNIFLDFGITNFNNKNISQNNHLLNKHLSSIILLRILLAGVFFFIAIAGGIIIGYTADMMKLLIAVGFNQMLASFILYLRSNIAGLHLFKTDSIMSVLDRFIMIALCSVLLYYHYRGSEFDIRMFVYAQTAAYLITTLIALIIVLKRAKLRRLHWRWPFFLMILKKSYPYAILVLLMASYNRLDGIMLERLLPFRIGAFEAGIYASAFRLLDAVNQFGYLFSVLLLPMFARMIKLKQNIEEMVRLSFSLLVIPALLISSCCFFYSREIMNLLYKGIHLNESTAVFEIIIWCFIPFSSTYIFGTLLTANGNLRNLNLMAGMGMLVNIALNLILIPKYSAVGAAVSSIITQSLTAVAQILMSKTAFLMRINYRLIGRIIFLSLSVLLLNTLIVKSGIYWISGFMLSIALSFALAFITGLISIKNIYRIIKYDE